MAALVNTVSSSSSATGGNVDKSKEWQMELLMEKLRSKSSQFKSFQETSKSVRMTMLDKRYSLDSVEKSQHQKCLDTLQHCIKVTSLQSMIERLESLTRQLGLKFMVGPSGVELFISSDMFYLEVVLEGGERGCGVRDVKVHHEGKVEQQSCAELVDCLSRQDFADFTTQLEGLASIYQLNAEKKIKCKAFSALQSLETDLNTLAQLQTFMKEPFNLLHKSPIGILEKRRGGHPMKLTYLVSPYELIDTVRGKAESLTVERVITRNLGFSVTICIEGSTAHKLPITPIISINRNMSNNTPSYGSLTPQNSAVIPACFFLRLSRPMPICTTLTKRIHGFTQLECGDMSATYPLLSLITQHSSEGRLDCANNRGLFVTLPDQQHCYFLTEGKGLQGVIVNGVPFTHPGHVPSILNLLRQQALFNTVLSSCIRPNSKQDLENMIMFEVSALSWQHLSISLEHPSEENMATAEIDLTDIANVTCKISSSRNASESCEITSELATKVFQRCLSIPITMRAVIKSWEESNHCKKYSNGSENFSLPLGSEDPGGRNGSNGNSLPDFTGSETKIKREHTGNGSVSDCGQSISEHSGNFLNESMVGFSSFTNPEGPSMNNLELNNLISNSAVEKSVKKHKRKMNEESWKSPKRRPGEDGEILLEGSSSDSNSLGTPSQEATSDIGITTPTSVLGFQSDLESSGLDATELVDADKPSSEYEGSGGDDPDDSLANEIRPETKLRKSRENQKSPSVVLDLDENIVPPSVSITPVTSTPTPSQNFNSVLTGMGLERRPGIEIIPIASAGNTTLPSSITITPITTSQNKSFSDERKDRKSGKSRSEEKSRLEKKRKRKREDESMRPPEKLPVKQDPLLKPVSVSIKPTELSPSTASATSPSNVRKFTSSPTHSRSLSSGKQCGPNNSGKQSSSKSSSAHHNLKHSSTPKHISPGVASPKRHITSPKHQTTSGTGKPSMSALKSATDSPSNKSNDSLKARSLNKDSSNRDKDRKTSATLSSVNLFTANSNIGSNKVKSSSVKLKHLDLSSHVEPQGAIGSENLSSPTGLDLSKSGNPSQVRNRKGSLSAVIDKLKSAQHCGPEPDVGTSTKTSSSNRENRICSVSTKVDSKSLGKSGETKNSEYMVKPSSDGMKITINKTRTKDSSKSCTPSNANISTSNNKVSMTIGGSSPKTHTGLKPGVNSGPASKKPQQLAQKVVGTSSSIANSATYGNIKSSSASGNGGHKISSLNKGSSSLVLTTSKSAQKAMSGNDRIRDRSRLISKTDKSLFNSSKSDSRRSSPTTLSREESDNDRDFKLKFFTQNTKMDSPFPAHLRVEGLIKQTLDTKFQIPKLSARSVTTDNDNKKSSPSLKLNSIISDNDIDRSAELSSKINDAVSKNDVSSKFPLALVTSSKVVENNLDEKSIRSSLSMTNNSLTNSVGLNVAHSPKLSNLTDNSQTSNFSHSSQSPNRITNENLELEKRLKNEQTLSNNVIGKDDNTNICKSTVYPLTGSVAFSSCNTSNESINLSIKSHDSCANGKFIVTQSKLTDDKKILNEVAVKVMSSSSSQDSVETLLDFSSSKSSISDHLSKISNIADRTITMLPSGHRSTPPMPSSPSVSIHIVKSPVTSPLVIPSPHSASPCITDDELMDEALVGIGK